jgi:hypothetical protein
VGVRKFKKVCLGASLRGVGCKRKISGSLLRDLQWGGGMRNLEKWGSGIYKNVEVFVVKVLSSHHLALVLSPSPPLTLSSPFPFSFFSFTSLS